MAAFPPIPGETPIDDISGLIPRHLKQTQNRVTVWPEQTVGAISVIRNEYIAAVRSADAGDYEPLIELHRRFTTP